MKLIVHMGLHKTASTWLQHLLNLNHAALARRGIWYAPQVGYPAHHHIAWALLRGEGDPFAAMLDDARAAGCGTVILSSEDLEGALFNPAVPALIEQVAGAHGVDAIEWHVVLRDPGAYFASLHAQLQHHVFADPLALFREVMAKGVAFIPEPLGLEGTPYWFYCFDSHAFVGGFAERTRWPVVAHDYADAQPFPGWRMIAALDALDTLDVQPDADGRNARLDEPAIIDGFLIRVLETIPDALAREAVEPLARLSIESGLAAVPVYAAVVGQRFAESHARALAAFGPPTRADQNGGGM